METKAEPLTVTTCHALLGSCSEMGCPAASTEFLRLALKLAHLVSQYLCKELQLIGLHTVISSFAFFTGLQSKVTYSTVRFAFSFASICLAHCSFSSKTMRKYSEWCLMNADSQNVTHVAFLVCCMSHHFCIYQIMLK